MLNNIITITDENNVKNAYTKRNYIYKMYIEDIVYRALDKLLNRNDIDKLVLNSVKVTTAYKDTIGLAVNTKFKEIKNIVNLNNDAMFTLEPKNPGLLETNMDVLSRTYSVVNSGYLTKLTPVKKETSLLVANTGFDLLDVIKNKIGSYAKEFIGNVKAVAVNPNELEDNIDITFLEVNDIDEILVEKGVISKYYSNNIRYGFDLNYDSSDLIKAVLATDYENVDLNKFDMEIDGEFHKYLEELDDDRIDEFKSSVEALANDYLTVKPFIDKLTNYSIPGIKDLQSLVYLWVASVNKYNSNKETKYLEIAGYIEELINYVINKIEQLKNNNTLALIKEDNKTNEINIYIVLKEYLKALEENKDIVNVIKGYATTVTNFTSVNLDKLKSAGFTELLNAYDKYLANLRYKQILNRINDLRDGYVYGFVKSSKELLPLINNNYELLEKLQKATQAYVLNLKIDQLLDIDTTVYDIIKNIMFTDLLTTIESYMNLGEKRFPDNEDDAVIFAIIMTLTEVTFSLFNIKVLDRVE